MIFSISWSLVFVIGTAVNFPLNCSFPIEPLMHDASWVVTGCPPHAHKIQAFQKSQSHLYVFIGTFAWNFHAWNICPSRQRTKLPTSSNEYIHAKSFDWIKVGWNKMTKSLLFQEQFIESTVLYYSWFATNISLFSQYSFPELFKYFTQLAIFY